MHTECHYCGKENNIVKSFPSEGCSRICQVCLDQTRLIPLDKLLAPFSKDMYRAWLWRECYLFLSNPKSDLKIEFWDASYHLTPPEGRMYSDRDKGASRNRWRSLLRANVKDWMPIKVEPKVNFEYGVTPHYDKTYFDGMHRATLAEALGEKEIRAWVRPSTFTVDEFAAQTGRAPYQTLVLPDGFIPGERPSDRWELIPRIYACGTILDLACNVGMNGTMAAVLNRLAKYHGFDKDKNAVELGRRIAQTWNVSEIVHIECEDINTKQEWPKADIIWFFSCSKVIGFSALMTAAIKSGARLILLETHNMHDDPDSARILAQPWEWEYCGNTHVVTGGPATRRLFAGVFPISW